jgi:hypothetical protein
MAIRTDTVEAPLSPSVTFRVPHGSKGARPAPRRGENDMTPCGVPGRKERRSGVVSTWATNGAGFTCRPSRHNRLPMVLVKVLSHGATTRRALLALRMHYQQTGDLFTTAELARLQFVRWLYRTGRLTP